MLQVDTTNQALSSLDISLTTLQSRVATPSMPTLSTTALSIVSMLMCCHCMTDCSYSVTMHIQPQIVTILSGKAVCCSQRSFRLEGRQE